MKPTLVWFEAPHSAPSDNSKEGCQGVSSLAARSRRGERGFVRGAGAGFAASAPLGGRASRRGRPRGAPRGSSWGVETCVCKFAARRIFALAKIFLTTHMQLQIFLELQICKWLLIDFLLKACKFASRSFFCTCKKFASDIRTRKENSELHTWFHTCRGVPPEAPVRLRGRALLLPGPFAAWRVGVGGRRAAALCAIAPRRPWPR